MIIEKCLQTFDFDIESSMYNTELPLDDNKNLFQLLPNNEPSIENLPTSVTCNSEMSQMRFEVDPASDFRKRNLSEYKPKREYNRKGEKAKPSSPRHFSDQNGRHYLNLLVCFRLI